MTNPSESKAARVLDIFRANVDSHGDKMKKGKNQIPDFSKKRKEAPQHGVPDATKPVQQHVPNPPVRTTKPPATTMKSGRRGS